MRRRHFTLEEALALLPRLTELLEALRTRRRELRELERRLADRYQRRVRGNGHIRGGEELARLQAELEAGITQLNEQLGAIHAMGIEVKDVEQGLIDFPTLREGREVYLCWRLGEPTIAWWHELETGFAGRQPLE
jgi:hypothetical protein